MDMVAQRKFFKTLRIYTPCYCILEATGTTSELAATSEPAATPPAPTRITRSVGTLNLPSAESAPSSSGDFIPWRLLIVDGHSLHVAWEVVKYALLVDHRAAFTSIAQAGVLGTTMYRTFTPEAIKDAWRGSGCWPVDEIQVLPEEEIATNAAMRLEEQLVERRTIEPNARYYLKHIAEGEDASDREYIAAAHKAAYKKAEEEVAKQAVKAAIKLAAQEKKIATVAVKKAKAVDSLEKQAVAAAKKEAAQQQLVWTQLLRKLPIVGRTWAGTWARVRTHELDSEPAWSELESLESESKFDEVEAVQEMEFRLYI
ncbi:hypothetical protein BDZ91DRAFT_797196 [Kalaharituber pfeilii]|nr:hypothetical protein BDZ91DRAFT_797196 [Kalaharituber pfeilii]